MGYRLQETGDRRQASRAFRRSVNLVAATVVLVAAVGARSAAQPPAAIPQRIVSLVPSVTEILFAVGAGPQVVGVSSFDREPPEVERLPKVGALIDPDLERILALRPDLVVVYASQADLREQLRRAGIASWPYAHAGLADVLDTIREIGATTGHAPEAAAVAAGTERRLDAVRSRVAGRPRPTALLVFGRERQSLRSLYASGGIGFLHDLLELAGGTNVLADVRRESVQASSELILTRAPEVIVEITAEGPAGQDPEAQAREVWSALSSVPAVRSGRIHVLSGSELVVPGPRVARAAERLAAVLHP